MLVEQYLNTRNEEEEEICILSKLFKQKLWNERQEVVFAGGNSVVDVLASSILDAVVDVNDATYSRDIGYLFR